MTEEPHEGDAVAPAAGRPGGDAVEDVVRQRLRSRLFGARSEAVKIGRYRVLERIGAGSMGVVFKAHDDELDRTLALKQLTLLGGELDPAVAAVLRKRVLSEARALASLSHPHVVGVFDVTEDGDGQITIAMEFVDGKPLDVWQTSGVGGAQITEAYLQAASGLAAAHAAGIVHRDFKPANAIMGRDGRVRVLDFGLARPAALEPGASPRLGSTLDRSESASDSVPTQGASAELGTYATGIVGTPRYMAPEQHRGDTATAATDQYNFCASLWEALCGAPPFVPTASQTLEDAKTLAALPDVDVEIPARVVSAMRRGLRVSPADRFGSMTELLEAMAPPRRTLPLRWFGAAAVAGAGVLGVAWWSSETPRTCDDGGLRETHWSPGRQQAIATAFAQTERPYAESAWSAAQRHIDGWVAQWDESKRTRCDAYRAGEESARRLDASTMCLAERQRALVALLDVLDSPDATVVDRALEAAHELPSLEPCADPGLVSPVGAPEDAPTIERWRSALAAAHANLDAGRYSQAVDRTNALLDEYADAGIDAEPIRVSALVLRGDAKSRLADHEGAAEDLEAGAMAAASIAAHPEVVRAAAALIWEYGEIHGNFERALEWAKRAEAVLEHSDVGPRLRSSFHTSLGAALSRKGDFEAALAEHHRALDISIKAWGENDGLVAIPLLNIGNVYSMRGEIDRALEHYERSIGLMIESRGPEHPVTLRARANWVGLMADLGRHAEARAEALEIPVAIAKSLGDDHPDRASALTNLAKLLSDNGEPALALEPAAEAERIFIDNFGDATRYLLEPLSAQSHAFLALERPLEARAPAERALVIVEATFGSEHVDTGRLLLTLGDIAITNGRQAAAERHLARAQAIFEQHGATALLERVRVQQLRLTLANDPE